MFTFATITYNHEKYIIEHLESIKYQISSFGQEETFSLVVSDDASTDKTIGLIESWLNYNRHLFVDVKILESEKNQGITKNYIRAVMSVESDNFKVLSGDDLYFKNNIFNIIKDFDIVISPTIGFDDEVITDIGFSKLLLMKYNDASSIKKLLEYHDLISAPGVFIKRSLAQDEGLMDFLTEIYWVEDYAKWYYLFHHKNNLKVYYEKYPHILYRDASGVSTNEFHPKRSDFKREEERLFKEWSIKSHRYPKYINPYKYYMKYLFFKLKYFDMKTDNDFIEKVNTLNSEMQNVNQYLYLIRERANKLGIRCE